MRTHTVTIEKLKVGKASGVANAGGFTMVELLVTMMLLTISLTGLAGLQVASIKRVTAGKRGAEATRLAEATIARYQANSYSLLPAALNPPAWEVEMKKDGTTEMRSVGVDGESDGPFVVQRMVEDFGGRKLVTVRVSWEENIQGNTIATQSLTQARNVMMSIQRAQ